MAVLRIAKMGNPVLLQKAASIADPTAPEIRRLAQDMQDTLEDIGVTPETEFEYLEAQQKVMSLYGQGRTSLDISDRLEEYGPDYEDPEQAYRDAQRRVDALFNIPTKIARVRAQSRIR